MTVGIVYYSRTGNTEHAAKLLEGKLKQRNIDVHLIPIEAVKKPGFFKAGLAATKQKPLPIKTTGFDFTICDTIIVGSPIWNGRPAPVFTEFFSGSQNFKGKKVAVFVTCGGKTDSLKDAEIILKEGLQHQGFTLAEGFLGLQMEKQSITSGEQQIDGFLEKALKK
jgi:flavodoxin